MNFAEFSSPKMSDRLAKVNLALGDLETFLRPALPFINSHLNHFFTESHWANLPEKLQRDLDRMSICDLKSKFKQLAAIQQSPKPTEEVAGNSRDLGVNFLESSLDEIVDRIGQLLLVSSKMSVKLEEFCGGQDEVGGEWSSWKFDPFMSDKKMHEVEVMSQFISKVANGKLNGMARSGRSRSGEDPVEFLVDVGSGKGYLSSFLTFLYDFRVLALDSSEVNTSGCTKRTKALEKNWSSFIRRAKARQGQGHAVDLAPSKRGKHWKSKESATSSSIPEESLSSKSSNPSESRLKNLTLFVTGALNVPDLLQQSFPEHFQGQLLTPNNCEVPAAEGSFGIIGLHTCGSLGVTSVQLFAECKSARFIVNVPCCFHLMTEQFQVSDSGKEGDVEVEESNGFPMSHKLKESGFYLGRNARMMSAQSVHRMAEEQDDEIPRPLLYRAILQKIIRDNQGPHLLENSVGRLGTKLSDFKDYVRKALEKTKLNSLQISDEYIESTFENLGSQSSRFHKYFLLRALFAPLVEAAVLLDRLAFLLQQTDVEEAFIVEMFDPFLSPRCHAILAFR